MTIEKANKDFAALTTANGFKATGEKTSTDNEIYGRTWSKKTQVAWYGESTDRLEITTWISYGIQMVRITRNGRSEDRIRDYSSPKRAMNAIAEIVRFAGYKMEVEA